MLLGAHCSVSGGLHKAFDEAKSLGINAVQIFTRNQQQWKARPIAAEEAENFKSAWDSSDVEWVFSHASYLINLGTPDKTKLKNSINALIAEVQRDSALGLGFTVLHPGSAKDSDEGTSLKSISDSLKIVLGETSDCTSGIALENTAGQGDYLGYKFEQLKEIMGEVASGRIGVCFDTCHAFAAGYDIRTEKGTEDVLDEFNDVVGLENLWALHLNDSKPEFASRVDRHDHIGEGHIGLAPFKVIMNRFPDVPKVIETPKSPEWDRKNLNTLRGLAS